MERAARRNIRTTIGVVHIVGQILLAYLAMEARAGSQAATNMPAETGQLVTLLGYIGLMFALYAIYYTLLKLLSHTHSSHER